MADDADDTLDERLERLQRRAENFRELLLDGEEVTVAFQDGEMRVEESYRSKFERRHPKLLGRLLSIDAQMDSGLRPYAMALLLAGVVLFGLHVQWWEGMIGETVNAALTAWWFYIVLPLIAVLFAHLGCEWREKRIYRRNRKELLNLIAAENLNRDELIVMIRDQDDIGIVLHQLKLDTWPFLPQAQG